jgi:SAM-dependent methyltransferase
MYNEYDVEILNQVIEHFADVRRLLETCSRLLKPGGHLFIETPSTEGIDSRLFHQRYWGGYHFPRHFYLFDEGTLKRLLGEHGFEPIRTRYLTSPAFWVQSFHHFLIDHGMKRLANFFSVRNAPLLALFTLLDITIALLGNKTSNMRIVAKKIA